MFQSFVPGCQLAQVRPQVTTPVTLFGPVEVRTEITLIQAPTTTDTISIELYHDNDSNTFDNTTLILNETLTIAGGDTHDADMFIDE